MAEAIVIVLALLLVAVTGQDTLYFETTEEYPADTFIGSVLEAAGLKTRNPDRWEELRFEFLPQPNQDPSYFSISPKGGDMHTAKVINREALCPRQQQCWLYIDAAVIYPRDLFQVIQTRVQIVDDNDQTPVFPQNPLVVPLSESLPVGSTVPLQEAIDTDSPQYGIQEYRLLMPSSHFRVVYDQSGETPSDLQLVLSSSLDLETKERHELQLLAIDGGASANTGTVTIIVEVEDANEHPPTFDRQLYEVIVSEDARPDQVIFSVQASDDDAGDYGRVSYQITEQDSTKQPLFAINSETGEVYLKGTLDFETSEFYELEITASNRGSNPLTSKITLLVQVQDVNDEEPVITVNTLTSDDVAQVYENAETESFVAHVSVFDGDTGLSGQVQCSLLNQDFTLIAMNRDKQYKVLTNRVFDRETQAEYSVTVECRDMSPSPLLSRKRFDVAILDRNDHTPVFEQDIYVASITENNQEGAFVMQVNASDDDIGENSRITYQIASVSEQRVDNWLHLSEVDGIVRAKASLDYETTSALQFTVIASDHGLPQRSSNTTVRIYLKNTVDEAPVFDKPVYQFHVMENAAPVVLLGQVYAEDREADPSNTIHYMLEGKHPILETFTINSTSGQLSTAQSLDRENVAEYVVQVVAADKDHPALRATATAVVTVTDDNDNFPTVQSRDLYNKTLPISNKVSVGHTITQITATDQDTGRNGQITYIISEGNEEGLFAINKSTGLISSARKLLHIKYQAFKLKILVSDNGQSPKDISTDVVILIDSSIPHLKSPTNNATANNSNLIIIIIVASVSGFLMLLLLIAIIALKTYDRRRHWSSQNQYTQAQNMVKGKQAAQKVGAKGKKKKTAVNFHLEGQKASERIVQGSESEDISRYTTTQVPVSGDRVVSQCSGRQRPCALTHTITQHPDSTFSPERRYVEGAAERSVNKSPPPSHSALSACHWPTDECRLEAHLLALLKKDCSQDTESASSAEFSNTDSGHGASEEGEQHSHVTSSNRHKDRSDPPTLSSIRQPKNPVPSTRKGQLGQHCPKVGRLPHPPAPPQRRQYPAAVTAEVSTAPPPPPRSAETVVTCGPPHKDVGRNPYGNGSSSVQSSKETGSPQNSSVTSKESLDPTQLQAEIDELFFKGVIV